MSGRLLNRTRAKLEEPPPGPFRPTFWRSPLRGPWLTSVLGTILVPGVTLMAITGLISQWNYRPNLFHNATTPVSRSIPALFSLPASWPSWTYTVTQGIHVNLGLFLIPIILTKLWSVIPRLFAWPPATNPATALERASTLVLVSSLIVEFVTGVLDVEYWYPWHFDFYTVHYYGAWIFFSAFALHFCLKLPTVRRAYRTRGALAPLLEDLAHTRPEPADDPTGLVPTSPAAPTISRRGLLATTGVASLAVLLANLGETLGGPFRRTALLAARGRDWGTGPNDFIVTTTARSAGITDLLTGERWRLTLIGAQRTDTMTLSRMELLNMPQHEATITITCVEGWSTTQHWTGVRLADLRRLAGAPETANVLVSSIQPSGPFRHITLAAEQVNAHDALLALRVNGAELSPDHGYPARVIVPNAPGVHNTKWVGSMEFSA
jgi:DMSO/TMAO reductase YedYZ molybdopterin-dependent catalytic subunit